MPSNAETLAVPFVDLRAQYDAIRPEIDAAIASVITETAFIGGPHLRRFEQAFAKYCGVNYCVGVANGTDALYVALRAIGIGAGDEVITVANSFIATSEAITMAGAKVVFVDCDPSALNIDVAQVEAKITSRTKAVLPVHLYGQPADLAPLRSLADAHGLKIIGDGAQAHGATYHGQPISRLADITCFSFYPGKNLGAYGDAGALVTDPEALATKARMIANHGRLKKYDHDFEGINSRLDGLQAAILDVKLAHLDRWTGARRAHAAAYASALAGSPVVLPKEIENVRAVYHLYVVRVPAHRRAAIQAELKESGIDTGVHYPIALPLLNAYRHLGYTANDFPVAFAASQQILSLPMFPELTAAQIDRVSDRLCQAMAWALVRRPAMSAAQHYNAIYGAPDAFQQDNMLYRRFAAALVAKVGLGHGARVLDAGCGQGYLSHFLKLQGLEVWCSDLSQTGLRSLDRLGDTFRHRRVVADLMAPPFDGAFDMVFQRSCSLFNGPLTEVHVKAVANLARCAKVGGVVAFVYNSNLSEQGSGWHNHSLRSVRQAFDSPCFGDVRVYAVNKLDCLLVGPLSFAPSVTAINGWLAARTSKSLEIVVLARRLQ